ncbi:MAG: hypothetical protein WBY94_08370, partial [Polyangiaceae bacterium]
MRWDRAGSRGRTTFAGAALGALAGSVPIALSLAFPASAHPVYLSRDRAPVVDALRGPSLLDVRAADPSSDA